MSKNSHNNGTGSKPSKTGTYFLYAVLILYLVLFIYKAGQTKHALLISYHIFMQTIPIFIIVIVFMAIIGQLIKRKQVIDLLGKDAGIKGWLLVAAAGILSHGPIYVWYPLLQNLQNNGMRNGFVSLFLYNRAVKIPTLPMMIYYFGIVYVLVFTFWMLVASIIQAKLTDLFDPYLD